MFRSYQKFHFRKIKFTIFKIAQANRLYGNLTGNKTNKQPEKLSGCLFVNFTAYQFVNFGKIC